MIYNFAHCTAVRYGEIRQREYRANDQAWRVIAAALLIASVSACSSFKQTTGEPAPIQTPDPIQAPDSEPTLPAGPPPSPDPIETESPVSVQQPAKPPTEVAVACECPVEEPTRMIVGEVEYALVGNRGLLKKARIDTGATTSSIGIAELTHFERDGDKWLRFSINDRLEGGLHTFERPLIRQVDIKQHNAEANRRPVVSMKITIGNIVQTIEMTLADREAFDFPLLIGRNFLEGTVIVDVSERYIATTAPEK